jgi:hypothetical protein
MFCLTAVRIYLGFVKRELFFHQLLPRNLGCTHDLKSVCQGEMDDPQIVGHQEVSGASLDICFTVVVVTSIALALWINLLESSL